MRAIELDAWERLSWSLMPFFVAIVMAPFAALTEQAASGSSLLAIALASVLAGSLLGLGLRSSFGMATRIVPDDDGLRIKPVGLREIRVGWQAVLAVSVHSYDRVRKLHVLVVDINGPRGHAAFSLIGKRQDEIGPFLQYAASRIRIARRLPTLGPLLSIRCRAVFGQAAALLISLVLCAVPVLVWKPAAGRSVVPLGCFVLCAASVAVLSRVRLRPWRAYHDRRTWYRGLPPTTSDQAVGTEAAGPRQPEPSPIRIPKTLTSFAEALVAAYSKE